MNHGNAIARPALGGALILAAIPVALAAGFFSGESLILAGVAAAGAVMLVIIASVRLAAAVKLIFLLIALTFLQRVFGYFKFGDLRGLNIGNLLLFASLCYWVLLGLKRERLYEPNGVDIWILISLIFIPLFSILFTVAFRRVPDYTLDEELSRFKQWVTPLIYFFLVCQCFGSKKDIHYLYCLVVALIALVVLHDLPELLQSRNWREGRSEGIVAQPNEYATLLACVAPFLILAVFLLRERPFVRIFAFALLSGIGLAILTTYSRAGYVAFALALAAGAYLAYRATGKFPVNTPVLVLAGASLLPVIAVPELMESVTQRFQIKSYKTATRKSYSQYKLLNQYSGDRLVLWKGALYMAQENPFFGVGFHVYHGEIAKYHPKGIYGVNYPHNVFLGALAEGGIIWLSALLVFFWKLFQVLHENWRLVVDDRDVRGQIICGGALITFLVIVWVSMSNDFFNPGPKNAIIWVLLAGAVRYGMVARKESVEAPAATR